MDVILSGYKFNSIHLHVSPWTDSTPAAICTGDRKVLTNCQWFSETTMQTTTSLHSSSSNNTNTKTSDENKYCGKDEDNGRRMGIVQYQGAIMVKDKATRG